MPSRSFSSSTWEARKWELGGGDAEGKLAALVPWRRRVRLAAGANGCHWALCGKTKTQNLDIVLPATSILGAQLVLNVWRKRPERLQLFIWALMSGGSDHHISPIKEKRSPLVRAWHRENPCLSHKSLPGFMHTEKRKCLHMWNIFLFLFLHGR